MKEDLGISDTSDLKIIARAIACYKKVNLQRPRVMVITNSDQPVVVGVSSINDIPSYEFSIEVNPVPKEKLLDSNGAGDSFVGGFLAEICILESEKRDCTKDELVKCVKAGNLIASQVV